MAEFATDSQARATIGFALRRGQRARLWSTRRRREPTGQREIARLRIGVPQAVHFRHASVHRMALIDSPLFDVALLGRYQRAFASKSVGAIEDLPLNCRQDRHLAGPCRPSSKIL
jgi:hypothetical protein